MQDVVWQISTGTNTGSAYGPNPVEAATRYVEFLNRSSPNYAMGILIRTLNTKTNKLVYVRSDIVLANAGMHAEATQMKKLYPEEITQT